jgi:PIN domain nuclease of toxin-antitoxin system
MDIEFRHVARVADLPFHDPFDRLLAAQAMVEDVTLSRAIPRSMTMA